MAHNRKTGTLIWEGSIVMVLSLIGQIVIIVNPLGG
jgi:uncharacterized membrane protein